MALMRKLLVYCSKAFYKVEKYKVSDEIMQSAIEFYPGNKKLKHVYAKVVLLNDIYHTVVYDTYKLSCHIHDKNIDMKLLAGDLGVIDDIRLGHGILDSRTNKERNLYSFASKYAGWHYPSSYPLFDSFVQSILSALNKEVNFHSAFKPEDLVDYVLFKSVIDALIKHLKLDRYRYQKMDKGLWIYGRFVDEKSTLRREMNQKYIDKIGHLENVIKK